MLVSEASDTTHDPHMAHFGFPESTNAMGDVLGLVAAMVTARTNSTTTHAVNGIAAVEAARVGNGQRSSLCFVTPPFLIVTVLSSMIYSAPRSKASEVDCTSSDCLLKFKIN